MNTVLYDPLSDELLRDPYPTYARLRAEQPIFWHETMHSWVVSRYHDCRDILRDNENFGRDRRRLGLSIPPTSFNLQSLDPPKQRPLRSLLVNAFRSQDMQTARAKSRELLARLFDNRVDGEPFDWMAEIAAPYALQVTADLIGVRKPELTSYVRISEIIAQGMDGGLVPANIEPGESARGALNELVEQWIAEEPMTGVLSTANQAADTTDVDPRLVINTLGTMFNASFGTIYAMAGNLLLVLADHRHEFSALETDTSIDTAVDELLRFEGPAQGTTRVCISPTTVAGTDIARGDAVVLLLASANRDEAQFSQPDRLILGRSPNLHLAFAWGAHSCLGAVFGRAATAELLRTLVGVGVAFDVIGPVERRRTATVRCPAGLTVTLGSN